MKIVHVTIKQYNGEEIRIVFEGDVKTDFDANEFDKIYRSIRSELEVVLGLWVLPPDADARSEYSLASRVLYKMVERGYIFLVPNKPEVFYYINY